MIGTSRCSFVSLPLVVLIVAVVGSAEAPAFAQAASTMSGVVRDATGSLLPGATVTVRNVASGAERTAVSGGDGRYQITAVPAGRYEVNAALISPWGLPSLKSNPSARKLRSAVSNW